MEDDRSFCGKAAGNWQRARLIGYSRRIGGSRRRGAATPRRVI